MRWQPFQDFAIRGTYSTGFRAPNLGELYGLTQFGATLQDPCSDAVVGNTPLANACRAQGAPTGFQQANTQITTFTGGNPNLKPEKSDSYTAGIQYRASWAEQKLASDHLTFEATYYNHKVKGAIQAADIQALLSACLAAGGTDPVLCKGFTRVRGWQSDSAGELPREPRRNHDERRGPEDELAIHAVQLRSPLGRSAGDAGK